MLRVALLVAACAPETSVQPEAPTLSSMGAVIAMRYRVIYDVTTELPIWVLFPLAGVPFMVIGYLMIRYRHHRVMTTVFRWEPETARVRAIFFSIVLAFSILWTIGAGLLVGVLVAGGRYAMYTGSAEVVEGVVEDFVPASGHPRTESFRVAGVEFSYRDSTYTGGFHQTSLNNGPIRENLPVRIHYIERPLGSGNSILKLEVAVR